MRTPSTASTITPPSAAINTTATASTATGSQQQTKAQHTDEHDQKTFFHFMFSFEQTIKLMI
jgi:hypothetical protein